MHGDGKIIKKKIKRMKLNTIKALKKTDRFYFYYFFYAFKKGFISYKLISRDKILCLHLQFGIF